MIITNLRCEQQIEYKGKKLLSEMIYYWKVRDWVKAHYNSGYGKIRSEWKRVENSVKLDITIPVNSTATVYLPAGDISEIKVK